MRQRFGNIGIYFWPVLLISDFWGVLLRHFQFHHHGMYLIVIEFPDFEILRHRATFSNFRDRSETMRVQNSEKCVCQPRSREEIRDLLLPFA
jgi:hypothetical protein